MTSAGQVKESSKARAARLARRQCAATIPDAGQHFSSRPLMKRCSYGAVDGSQFCKRHQNEAPTHLAVEYAGASGIKAVMKMACGVHLASRYIEHPYADDGAGNKALSRVTCPRCLVAWDAAHEKVSGERDLWTLLREGAR